ncbi:hypothetical protein [Streptomyces sp. 142MFCol3.1]|uniref:hypothetical protein n=1 Tax=Streptomyces sp. 142MFCol3.1 TaxID=1172179 RepID=UPI0004018573|nr:hypothetical protein [Streptomyces sp. 142MFCol3.1]
MNDRTPDQGPERTPSRTTGKDPVDPAFRAAAEEAAAARAGEPEGSVTAPREGVRAAGGAVREERPGRTDAVGTPREGVGPAGVGRTGTDGRGRGGDVRTRADEDRVGGRADAPARGGDGLGGDGLGRDGIGKSGDRKSGDRTAGAERVGRGEGLGDRARTATGATGARGVTGAAEGGTGSGRADGHGGGRPAQDAGRPDTPLLAKDESDTFALRLRHALGGFVDGPRDSVEEADHVLEELAGTFTEAVTRRRRTLRTVLQQGEGKEAGADTEQLRLALRDYREITERLLHL